MYSKFTLGLSAFALAVGLAACSGDAEENADSNEQPDQADEQAAEVPAVQTNYDEIPDVVATINGIDVSKDAFIEQYEQTKQQSQMMMGGEVDSESTEVDDALKDQSVDMLVNTELLNQASNEEGIEVSEEDANQQLDQIKAMYQIQSDEDLEEILGQQDMTIDEFKEEIRESMKPQKYIEEKANIEEPTDEEIEAKYEELTEAMGDEAPPLDDTREEIIEQIKIDQANEAAPGIIDELEEQGDIEIFV
ncbi:SurA N-terminal domain-containing protein [Alkalicoccobacillus murimartini]|uniref:peptidylprolyl isomerase n=1 Tax=Alkalicoccobacillus murimartini TaxID=171685 RepID=A0ABT9YED5_9BACI|nr:SurA N-terminal domain-containing protein [Alkalicoccobacillus murimartini]MDQ0206209.1 peptidyl-prolyl cis-trans isomerase SurA [Alkalicoccobacillus murimartini]